MRVWLTIPEGIAEVYARRADETGLTVEEVLVAALGGYSITGTQTTRERVGALVNLGLTDADVAAMTRLTNGAAAGHRRALGLPANHRYGARRAAANPD